MAAVRRVASHGLADPAGARLRERREEDTRQLLQDVLPEAAKVCHGAGDPYLAILRREGNIEHAGPRTGVDMFWVEVRDKTSVNFFDTTWTGDAPPPAPETSAPVVRTISRVARAGAPRDNRRVAPWDKSGAGSTAPTTVGDGRIRSLAHRQRGPERRGAGAGGRRHADRVALR